MIFELDASEISFPNPSLAEEDGLLAIGGDLSTQRLLLAYQHGIFPWYDPEDPICWFSPDPRCVIYPDKIKISKSMKKILHQNIFTFTYDESFAQVIQACANVRRKDQEGTWISDDICHSYTLLHRLGYAHSIEVWKEGILVGGLYGVLVGNIFVGESMFSNLPNASKAALIYLGSRFRLQLIDCQVPNDHLTSMGAQLLSRTSYLENLSTQNFVEHGLQKLFLDSE